MVEEKSDKRNDDIIVERKVGRKEGREKKRA